MRRVIESPLRFAHVGKAEFVHNAIAGSPGMTEVPLLETLLGVGTKSRNVSTGGLEIVKGAKRELIGEVVIGAELLLVVDVMIEAERRLIRAILPSLNRLEKS